MNFIEKEITGEDLSEILNLTSDDICISLFSKYFFIINKIFIKKSKTLFISLKV